MEETKSSQRLGSVWSAAAAFGAYFCMYAYRKPFTAAAYQGLSVWGIGYKPLLVTSQVLGYTLAKFMGIKVIAEMPPGRRVALLLALIGGAELALLLFGFSPAPLGVLWFFCNGIALGMVFGLVLGFLEGRRHTEAMAAGLCVSFIVSDGVVKSAGATLLKAGISEFWMPFATGLLFAAPLLVSTWMLSRIPAPSASDIAARSERLPMDGSARGEFFRRYALGLALLVTMYLLITILRSLRSDFAPEIWAGLGAKVSPDIFARSETLVGVGVLLLTGAMVFLRDNRRAFSAAICLALSGTLLIALALLGLQASHLSPFAFMVLSGLGLYLPYFAVHTTLFERLIAMTRDRGNIGYLMYLADAFGYLGYVFVLLAKNFAGMGQGFLSFYLAVSWFVAVACALLLLPCWRYFLSHPATQVTSKGHVDISR